MATTERPAMVKRHDDGTYVIEEHNGPMVGEYRFSLDRRIHVNSADGGYKTLTNISWFRTYRGALNALSMEKSNQLVRS